MASMIESRPVPAYEAWLLRENIRRVQEPYVQMLVDLYSVSIPTITIADGVVEITYTPEVEEKAERIRQQMNEAVEMFVRYKPL